MACTMFFGVSVFIVLFLEIQCFPFEILKEPRSSSDDVFETTDWQLRGSSIYTNAEGGVVFKIEYSTSKFNLVEWAFKNIVVFDGESDFTKSSTSSVGLHVSILTSSKPASEFQNQLVSVRLIDPQANQAASALEVFFDTSNMADRFEVGDASLSYSIETVRTDDAVEKIITIVPSFDREYEYSSDRFWSQYAFLKESGQTTTLEHMVSYVDRPRHRPTLGMSIENITTINTETKAKVTLHDSVKSYAGDLQTMFEIGLHGDVIGGLRLVLFFPNVFTNGDPVPSLQGKFCFGDPYGTNIVLGNTRGFIWCHGMGYPPPSVQLMKVNGDKTLSAVPFENKVKSLQLEHHSSLMVGIPNVTMSVEGDYACVSEVNGVTKRKDFHMDVSVPAKFDKDATVVSKSPENEVTVKLEVTAKPEPRVTCMENTKDGSIIDNYPYVIEDNWDGNTKMVEITFNESNNGTDYGPLYKLVCSTRIRWYYDDVDDWITVPV